MLAQELMDEAAPAGEGGGPSGVSWSGGDLARNAAEAFAKANDDVTLEMTASGQMLTATTSLMPWEPARPLWVGASRDFARGARAEISVFQNASGVRLSSIWREVEYKVLKTNPRVRRINYFGVMSDGSVVRVG